MNKIYFPLFLLTVFLFSCEDDDDSTKIIECQEDNYKVTISKLVKSDYKANQVSNSYEYDDLDLISSRIRNAPGRVYEYDYVYDCRNNLVEVNVEETADPQYDGSSSFFEYDDQNRLVSYHTSFQGEFNYNLSYEGNLSKCIWHNMEQSKYFDFPSVKLSGTGEQNGSNLSKTFVLKRLVLHCLIMTTRGTS